MSFASTKLSQLPMRRLRVLLGLCISIGALLFVSFPQGLHAQSLAGFGSISGVVQDSTGAVIPGAKVLIDNPAKGIHKELETTGGGTFDAPALVPASGYSVTVSKAGFAGYQTRDITVAVGQTVTLNPTLTVSGTATEVQVTAAAPLIDQTKVDTSQVVTSEQILELPINGRRVDSFVLLTPGVTNDAGFGLLSFRGYPGGNSFLTDGNDTTNSFYDENAGRTRAYNIAQDAVQEFQVVSSNYLAEYGHASGGVVNTVTRSGSNSFHGTAYEFFRNRTLNATDITAHGVNPPEWRHQAGLSVGGPIKKDKLFYFFNGELQRRSGPIVSSNLTNNTMFDLNGNFLTINPQTKAANCPTTGTGAATQAQCDAAVAYLQSRVKTQLIPRTVDTNLLFGKIDYHPNDRNALSFSANYLDFRSPNGIQTQLSLTDGNAIGNNANTNVFDRTGRASWTYTVNPNAINEVRFGYFKDRQFDPASPSLTPSFGPVPLTVQSVSNLGFANQYPRLNPSEQRFQVADTYSWSVGKHNLKFGADWDHVEDYVFRLANKFGSYTYPSLSAFALDFSGSSTGKHWQSYTQGFGNPVVDVAMREVAFFVQDQWRVTPKLTVSPGLRYEYSFIPQPALVNSAFPQTGVIPNNGTALAPRLGVAYALNDKTVVRTGFGLFFNRVTTSAIENLYITNGIYQASYTLNSNQAAQLAAGPAFPNALAVQPTAVQGSSSILYADPNWRSPYSEQADLAIEREIARNTALSVSYVWSRGLHIQATKDANAADPTTSVTYPILDASGAQVGSYTTPVYTKRINPAFGTIGELQSGSNSFYDGLLINLNNRYSNWFQGNLSYTYSHAIDDGVGGAGTNILFGSNFPTSVFNGNYRFDRGSSSTDQRHRLVINAIVSPTFVHRDDWMARYLINNWELSGITVAASSQAVAPTISVRDRATGALNSTINGLGGWNRVPFESISGLAVGPYYKTDARITKQLPFGERMKVSLGFEASNIFNHVIVYGGSPRVNQQYTAIRQTSGPLNGQIALVPNPQYGSINQTQAPPDGTTARRAQAVVRISW